MAAGDVKGDEAFVVNLTAGTAVVKGNLVHYESDQKYDPTVSADLGPFAVAIEAAAADTNTFRGVIWGRAEVVFSGATAAKIGTPLMAATAASGPSGSVSVSTDISGNQTAGVAMEAMDTSGNTYTMWVGLQSG